MFAKVKVVNFIPFRIEYLKTKTIGNNTDKISWKIFVDIESVRNFCVSGVYRGFWVGDDFINHDLAKEFCLSFLLDQKRNKKVNAVNFIPFRIEYLKTKTIGNNADKILLKIFVGIELVRNFCVSDVLRFEANCFKPFLKRDFGGRFCKDP